MTQPIYIAVGTFATDRLVPTEPTDMLAAGQVHGRYYRSKLVEETVAKTFQTAEECYEFVRDHAGSWKIYEGRPVTVRPQVSVQVLTHEK